MGSAPAQAATGSSASAVGQSGVVGTAAGVPGHRAAHAQAAGDELLAERLPLTTTVAASLTGAAGDTGRRLAGGALSLEASRCRRGRPGLVALQLALSRAAAAAEPAPTPGEAGAGPSSGASKPALPYPRPSTGREGGGVGAMWGARQRGPPMWALAGAGYQEGGDGQGLGWGGSEAGLAAGATAVRGARCGGAQDLSGGGWDSERVLGGVHFETCVRGERPGGRGAHTNPSHTPQQSSTWSTPVRVCAPLLRHRPPRCPRGRLHDHHSVPALTDRGCPQGPSSVRGTTRGYEGPVHSMCN